MRAAIFKYDRAERNRHDPNFLCHYGSVTRRGEISPASAQTETQFSARGIYYSRFAEFEVFL
jgi:hypothetical protein